MGFSRQDYWSGVSLPSPVSSTKGALKSINNLYFGRSAKFVMLCPEIELWKKKGKEKDSNQQERQDQD